MKTEVPLCGLLKFTLCLRAFSSLLYSLRDPGRLLYSIHDFLVSEALLSAVSHMYWCPQKRM